MTARAPAAGDLRFQQVDAAATVNGYGNGASLAPSSLAGLGVQTYGLSFGTPFWTGAASNCVPAQASDAAACSWTYAAVPLPSTQAELGLAAGFASDSFADWEFDLVDPNWPGAATDVSPGAANAVINSIDLQPASALFAASWVQVPSNQQTAFSLNSHTVAPADLPSMVASEGANSRVITAVSFNAGSMTYLSYAWLADPATVYDAEVSVASAANAATTFSQRTGYIITAIGRADDAGNIVLVGTRVHGDTMARPYQIAQSSGEVETMMLEGFATVGVIQGAGQGGGTLYIGER